MSSRKDDELLFSIGIVLSLFVWAIAFFCGDDVMRNIKIWIYFGAVVLVTITFIIIGINIFTENPLSEYKSWEYIDSVMPSDLKENIEKIAFGSNVMRIERKLLKNSKKLKTVEFHSRELTIEAYSFSYCTELEEIYFFEKPKKVLDENAFSGCISLKRIYLIGDKHDWKDFEITIPEYCEIIFVPYIKNILVTESDCCNRVSQDVFNANTNTDISIENTVINDTGNEFNTNIDLSSKKQDRTENLSINEIMKLGK